MFIDKPLPFIEEFINEIDVELRCEGKEFGLSQIQKKWLGFCLLCIIVLNSINWAGFERISLESFTESGLSWMYRNSKITWEILLKSAVRVVVKFYKIKSGVIVIDDSDNARSKNAKLIYKIHKIKDKKTGGYVMGQTLVMLILVSESVTIPIGFKFYAPDSGIQKWEKEDAKLKKAGIIKRERPKRPKRSEDYPTKESLALQLLNEFSVDFPEIKIKAITADALYGTHSFMNTASQIFKGVQVISQLRKNQIIELKNEKYTIADYFKLKPYYPTSIILRGTAIKLEHCYTIAKVKSHQWEKRIIVAIKYEGESEYRYITATDMSWNAESIAATYSLRWLIEVFFQDWKTYEGWENLTKHTGYEGSSRGLILSLMLDLCLLLHPEQKVRIKDKLPAFTVGSLREKIVMETLLQFIESIINTANPKEKLQQLTENVNLIFKPNLSTKHLNNLEWDFLEKKKTA